MSGKVVAELAKSDLTRFTQLGLKKVEMFTYLAADGKTTLYGTIAFPSNFDRSKKYPTLVPVYGGPASGSNVPTETFATPAANTEYGFLVVNLMSRAAPGMGRRTLDSIYMKLGQTEMDDMAEGIKALWTRPYFDNARQRQGATADREIERVAERLAGLDGAPAMPERDAEVRQRAGVLEPGRGGGQHVDRLVEMVEVVADDAERAQGDPDRARGAEAAGEFELLVRDRERGIRLVEPGVGEGGLRAPVR